MEERLGANCAADAWRLDQLERVGVYRNRRGLHPLDPAAMTQLARHVSAAGSPPVDYVLNLFDRHQVVFVGMGPPSKRSIEFLAELVGALPKAGVGLVAAEFICVDDQGLVEASLRTEQFEPEGTFGSLARWALRYGFAFEEMVGMLRAAWESAQRDEPVRVIGTEYDLNFETVTETADLRSPYPWEHLRDRGTAARHIHEVIEREVLGPGRQALVLTRTQHALTGLRRTPHRLMDAFDTELVDGRVVGAANHTYATLADRVATVLIHQPLPAEGPWGEWARPADGAIDALFAMRGGPPMPWAFDTSTGLAAELPCATSVDAGTLGDWASAWVYLETDDQRAGPTPLQGVIAPSAVDLARRVCLDGRLRGPDVQPEDFDQAFAAAAAAGELAWTQIL